MKCLITAVLLCVAIVASDSDIPEHRYFGVLESAKQVYDGDSLSKVRVKIADFSSRGKVWAGIEITDDGIYATSSLRLAGIDAPERRGSDSREKALAMQSRSALLHLIMEQGKGRIEVKNPRTGKFAGRVICEVWIHTEDGAINVSDAMLETGLAKPYTGGKRPTW